MAQRTLKEWRFIRAVQPRVRQRNDLGDGPDRGRELPAVEKGRLKRKSNIKWRRVSTKMRLVVAWRDVWSWRLISA
jgi:hypothetical protein